MELNRPRLSRCRCPDCDVLIDFIETGARDVVVCQWCGGSFRPAKICDYRRVLHYFPVLAAFVVLAAAAAFAVSLCLLS